MHYGWTVDGQLPLNIRKEQFSTAYIRAVAAVCGFEVTCPDTDFTGVDAIVSGPLALGNVKIDIQAKCTKNLNVRADGTLSWQVDEPRTFEMLSATKLSTPRILVIMSVPDDIADFLEHQADRVIAHAVAYYVSLHGETASAARPTISIPKTQMFTKDSLPKILTQAASGEMRIEGC